MKKTEGSGLQPGTLWQRSKRRLLGGATTPNTDAAVLVRGGGGCTRGKSKGGQNNGDQGNSAADHGDLEGIKL